MGKRLLDPLNIIWCAVVALWVCGAVIIWNESNSRTPPEQHNTHWSSNVTQAILYCSKHAFIIGEMAYIQGATPEQERLLVIEDFDLCIKQTNVAI